MIKFFFIVGLCLFFVTIAMMYVGFLDVDVDVNNPCAEYDLSSENFLNAQKFINARAKGETRPKLDEGEDCLVVAYDGLRGEKLA